MRPSRADITEAGTVVVVQFGPAAHAYVRVAERSAGGLRVSWHGVEYLVVGERVGADLGRRPMWRADRFEPWAIEEPPAPASTPAPTPARRRRPAKGARA